MCCGNGPGNFLMGNVSADDADSCRQLAALAWPAWCLQRSRELLSRGLLALVLTCLKVQSNKSSSTMAHRLCKNLDSR